MKYELSATASRCAAMHRDYLISETRYIISTINIYRSAKFYV